MSLLSVTSSQDSKVLLGSTAMGLSGPARDPFLSSAHRQQAMVLAANDSVTVTRVTSALQLEQALWLRNRVMVNETKANPGLSSTDSLGTDSFDPIFDPYCEHLIAVELATDRVVGTCRLILPNRSAELGCLNMDRAFWLTSLNSIRDETAELGHTCIVPEYRNGSTIRLLWKALLHLAKSTGQRYAVAAASVSLDDGGDLAVRLTRHLTQTCMANEPWRAWPRQRLPMIQDIFSAKTLLTIPLLFKSHLQISARLLGEPHYNQSQKTADFPFLIDLNDAQASSTSSK